jgi:hypothetical protein
MTLVAEEVSLEGWIKPEGIKSLADKFLLVKKVSLLATHLIQVPPA